MWAETLPIAWMELLAELKLDDEIVLSLQHIYDLVITHQTNPNSSLNLWLQVKFITTKATG